MYLTFVTQRNLQSSAVSARFPKNFLPIPIKSIILIEYHDFKARRYGESSMQPMVIANGEGASAVTVDARMLSVPAIVVWPVFGWAGASSQVVEQIYCMAWERACAELRPSAYERTQRVSLN
jgi:hypothetical protein